jgi:diaminopropionate ammonia-lyase
LGHGWDRLLPQKMRASKRAPVYQCSMTEIARAYTPNRSPQAGQPLLDADRSLADPATAAALRALLRQCPRYAPTPLVSLPGLASRLGIGALMVKDEGQRLGLRSFKALGGALTVFEAVRAKAEAMTGQPVPLDDLASPALRAAAAATTVACATDGNHGLSVAAGARIIGCACVIVVHDAIDPERHAAIEARGARVIVHQGSYDGAVDLAAAEAAAHGWTLLSDTSWPGYEAAPTRVMQGYGVIADEVIDTIEAPPTHVFLQAGVGGLAASVGARMKAQWPSIRLVVVEPFEAACLFESARQGRLTETPEIGRTVMAMLECNRPSMIAWRVLERIADGFVLAGDTEALAAMRALGRPEGEDTRVVAGETGGAGLAGLMAALADPAIAGALALGVHSRVVLVNSEGATAPALYERLVGVAA